MQVVWFKRDLRVHDHAPLLEASRRGPVLGLYIYEPAEIAAPECSARHLDFIYACLQELRDRLRELGSELLIRQGDAIEVFERLSQEVSIQALWSHQEVGTERSYRRDQELAKWCAQQGLNWHQFPLNGVTRGKGSRKGWASKWLERMASPLQPTPLPQPKTRFPEAGPVPQAKDLGISEAPLAVMPAGGEAAAHQTLDDFLYRRGRNYRSEMSSPLTAFDACSRISPYLSWGALSVRQVFHALARRKEELKAQRPLDQSWLQSLRSFASRLRWHCHFMQKLEDQANLDRVNFVRCFDGLRAHDPEKLEAWKQGRTGYPMVDACMRALAATGYLNFRMRAMLMSFASYHLWLDWREPGLHLARLFLDYEPGIHWPQVQMQSGTTGINTIRVYSPVKQAQDQDPEGRFIKHWVPELRQVPENYLAHPWTMPLMEQAFADCHIGSNYPEPIVPHPSAYHQAHHKIRQVLRSPRARDEARQVLKKHGSRRKRSLPR